MRGQFSVCALCISMITAQAAKLLKEISQKAQENGQVCVMNGDCASQCCIHGSSVSGLCMAKAPVGQVCGFILSKGTSIEDHYQLCEDCDTFCCCGTSCCPTSYCVAVLDLKPSICPKCNTGCCCSDAICCPVQYCAPGLTQKHGVPCQRCPSGCCCGDACCLSTFCKGSTVGEFCTTCASGCCCGSQCCAVSFCDTSQLSLTRLMLLYGGTIPHARDMNLDATALSFPKPMDAGFAFSQFSQPYLGYVQQAMYNNIPQNRFGAYPCPCSTGCCCDFGCCNHIYCI